MMVFAEITVVLLDNTIVAFKNSTLKNVAKECLSYPLANSKPLLVQIGADYKLHFNVDVFRSWIQQEITYTELSEQLKIIALVRNKEPIIIKEHTVDVGSLWLRKEYACILVDKDDFISVNFDDRFTILG